MGKHFGELANIRGLVSFKISPFEQRAFANALSKGVPNFISRILDNVCRVLPPFIVGYTTYTVVEKLHDQTLRKNPEDYVDEV